MYYARFDSGSDIYLEGNEGGWTCSMCKLQRQDDFGLHGDTDLKTLKSVWAHLQEHTEAGHLVHESTTIRVKSELDDQRAPIQEFTEEVFPVTRSKRSTKKKITLKRKQ